MLSQTFSLHSRAFLSPLTRLYSRVFSETPLYSKIFTPLYSKLSELLIQAGSTAPRRTPIQARREERRSKHTDPSQASIHSLCLWSKHDEKNANPSTPIHSLSPIQARREERRSKHADLPQASIHSLIFLFYTSTFTKHPHQFIYSIICFI